MKSFEPGSTESYLALARSWAATVTVVTVRRAPRHLAAGVPELDGFTATAFLTVSMSPPIIAVSATVASSASSMLREASAFAVSLLAPEQIELAATFALPPPQRAGWWERVPTVLDDAGVPLIAGATGAWSARVRQLIDAGDHTLVLGDVTAIHLGDGNETLLYHNRAFRRVAPLG